MYFCTIFWDDITIIWYENIVYFHNWEKKMLWINKKFVYLIFINKLSWHHPKIMYENIVQKDMNKLLIISYLSFVTSNLSDTTLASAKNISKIYVHSYVHRINKLSWHHSKIMYENIVQKDMNKLLIIIYLL